MPRDPKSDIMPNGKPFPPKVLARRAKHAAMKAAHPERYMTREEAVGGLLARMEALERRTEKLERKP